MLTFLPATVTEAPEHYWSDFVFCSGWDKCGEDGGNPPELLQLDQGLFRAKTTSPLALTPLVILWNSDIVKIALNMSKEGWKELKMFQAISVRREMYWSPKFSARGAKHWHSWWSLQEPAQPHPFLGSPWGHQPLLPAVNCPQKATPTSQQPHHILILWKRAQEARRELEFGMCSFSHMRIPKPRSGSSFEGTPGPSAGNFLFLAF